MPPMPNVVFNALETARNVGSILVEAKNQRPKKQRAVARALLLSLPRLKCLLFQPRQAHETTDVSSLKKATASVLHA